MLDQDTDSYLKIPRAILGGQPSGNLTPDRIVDNITLYWLTGTGVSATRENWESAQSTARAAGQAPPQVSLPVGFTVFPARSSGPPHLTYYNQVDSGGHFAASEESDLFAQEVRAAFRSLR